MFSGGLLSRNLSQSFGKIRKKRHVHKHRVSNAYKKDFGVIRLKVSDMLLNWIDENAKKKVRVRFCFKLQIVIRFFTKFRKKMGIFFRNLVFKTDLT